MQIVIDIDENRYNECKRLLKKEPEFYADTLSGAVAKGIVLPKNHGRLIDATDLLEICEFHETEMEVSGAPTVVPGAWEWEKENKNDV